MIPLRLTLQAQVDVENLTIRFAQSSEKTAVRFFKALKSAFELIQAHPEIAGLLQTRTKRFADYRVWQVKGFRRYLIFYRLKGDKIEIARVVHGMRDLDQLLPS